MIQPMSCVHTRNVCRTCICMCVCSQVNSSLHLGMFTSMCIRGTGAMQCVLSSRGQALREDRRVAYTSAPAARRWHSCLHSRRSHPLEEEVFACLLEEGEQFRDHHPNGSQHPRDHGEVVEVMVRW